MDSFTFFTIFFDLIALIILIAFLVKFWHVCDDVREIKDRLAGSNHNPGYSAGAAKSQGNQTVDMSTAKAANTRHSHPKIIEARRILNSLKQYDEIKVNGVKCYYMGSKDGYRIFMPASNQNLTGKKYLSKDSAGNDCFQIPDYVAEDLIDL